MGAIFELTSYAATRSAWSQSSSLAPPPTSEPAGFSRTEVKMPSAPRPRVYRLRIVALSGCFH